MTSLAVLIPVKSSGVKSRLSEVLSSKERQELATLLLSGVLDALGEARMLGACRVVSSDGRVLKFAAEKGAGIVSEPRDDGVNAAVARGIMQEGSAATVLVLPSDLPFIRAREIRHILSLKRAGADVVLVPSSSFDGTNALVFRPSVGLSISYDDDSFWNHLKRGARKGLSVAVSVEPGIMFDVDSPADFLALARSKSVNPPATFARRAER